MTKTKKTFITIFVVIILLGIGFTYYWFYVPYSSSSVRAGELNYVMHKGIIFETYEGELIQTGFRSKTGAIGSNEFEFSIADEKLAKKLMGLTGSNVKLHYKEYFGVVPWRGYTRYIVDSIVSVDPQPNTNLNEIDPAIFDSNTVVN
ncbi:hypothetical protein D0T53_09770 [Dysgonomonas sp. 216]|uniref:hypothetical protein n=1 Tax=Dysgonomonas sp. 216 TaxID=2302934 RepID=UPI0013D661C4|nr:hypothetical protein [Dysgonomonas sp. 216]NDW19199.1 hypothetical protein [Dysgonomonas sp. 216]